jgi:hypothetical protein
MRHKSVLFRVYRADESTLGDTVRVRQYVFGKMWENGRIRVRRQIAVEKKRTALNGTARSADYGPMFFVAARIRISAG